MSAAASRTFEPGPVPDVLPVLAVNEPLVMPGTLAPMATSAPVVIQLLDDAMRLNRMLAVVVKKEASEDAARPEDLRAIGSAAVVRQLFRPPDGSLRLMLQGVARIRLGEVIRTEPYLVSRVELAPDTPGEGVELEALAHTARDVFKGMIAASPELPNELAVAVDGMSDPVQLAYALASLAPIDAGAKQKILEQDSAADKLRTLVPLLQHELAVRQLGREIAAQTQEKMSQEQRQYLLREQLRTIREQLGENEPERIEALEMRRRMAETSLSEEVRAEIEREIARFERLPAASPEYGMVRTYLEWVLALPWQRYSGGTIDVGRARTVLDEDHYDLDEIKDRILDHLAVMKLRQERRPGDSAGADDEVGREPILCLLGPPGVGKTSLGQSIARAMGRKFIRISLGGIHDEAEIRGHRRTYIGALPGRIMQALRRGGTADPVLMLDEIDKLGAGIQGDPAAALLEVLDPAQNRAFVDTYLGVPFDLSHVTFIGTANAVETIPAALLDRTEVLRLSGYTDNEKIEIAKRHLLPKLTAANGLRPDEIAIDDGALRTVVRQFTREAGVRGLERQLSVVFRKVARRISEGATPAVLVDSRLVYEYLGRPRFFDEVADRIDRPGVATGLAWTPVGGEILFVEASFMEAPDEKLILTGMLGDVMRESAQAALSWLRAAAPRDGVRPDFFAKKNVHIHVPAGAVPKDGPSAGVTMLAALASAASERPVRDHVAMTGEITLSGKVLPVGGIRDKVLAAHRAGIRTVILPRRNERDLEDVPADARAALTFVFVDTAEEVLAAALLPEPDIDVAAGSDGPLPSAQSER
jgi:ATP-dependent Lon protease